MIDNKQLWDSCLLELQNHISKATFATWFKNTSLVKQEFGTAFIGVPNEFVRDWLKNKFEKLILKSLMMFSSGIRAVEFTVIKNPEKALEKYNNYQAYNQMNELPLHDYIANKDDNLNPRYTFANFIVGSFNEVAYAAAQAIISKPGSLYNPFFIYGPTGVGKTHIIQSTGNAIKERFPGKTIHYTSLEKFAQDFVNSLRTNKVNEFKQKYRRYDVLIIDDIQFISNKEKIQEELFHLFNTLYEGNKQIIFSSDKHPNYIPNLEDRLRTRFNSGMIVDINEPDMESKMAIIKNKAQNYDIPLSEEVVVYLAETIGGSVREIEGCLNTLSCHYQLRKKEVSLYEAKKFIKNNIKPKKQVSIPEVVKIVSDYFNISEDLIYEKTRRKEIVKARQIIMYVLREDFSVSYPHIGQKLGGKDHTTVIHSCEKIKEDLKTNHGLIKDLEQIRVMVSG